MPHDYYQNIDYLSTKQEGNGLYSEHRCRTGYLHTSVIWINTSLQRGESRMHLVSCVESDLRLWKPWGLKVGLVQLHIKMVPDFRLPCEKT